MEKKVGVVVAIRILIAYLISTAGKDDPPRACICC